MILKAKSRILDKIEKRLTKMSLGIDKRHFEPRKSLWKFDQYCHRVDN